MLYCRTCGQCIHMDDMHFYGNYSTSGWEQATVDDDGGYMDYVNGETTDNTLDNYECPYCESHDVDVDSSVSEETARGQRAIYENQREILRKESERERKEREYKLKQKDPTRKWDSFSNITE